MSCPSNVLFVEKLQDISLASKAIDSEATFGKRPTGALLTEDSMPHGPSAVIEKFDIDAVRWDKQLEKSYYDTDLKASEAVLNLHNKDVPFTAMQKAFSVNNPIFKLHTDIISKTIKIRSDVYEGACNGVRRDRMTIAHEFAHFITLCVCGFRLARSFGNVDVPPYCDPEWQAKCLAGELMIDSDLVKGMSRSEVSEKCGVSYDAAKLQLSKI